MTDTTEPEPRMHYGHPAPSTGFVEVGDVPFGISTLDRVARWLVDVAAVDKVPINVRLANAYNVALASKDERYRRLLIENGINFPDGTPVVWFMNARRAGERAERVRGPSLFGRTVELGVARGTRHFLLGSTAGTLTRLREELLSRYPGAIIAGTYSPPFSPIDSRYVSECVAQIESHQPDLVWMGLGTPKQDELGTRLAAEARITTVNVGAAFDFVAGTVREAPPWVQRSGFEWLYRLASEPRRLWRRYLFGNITFIAVATRGAARLGRSASKK